MSVFDETGRNLVAMTVPLTASFGEDEPDLDGKLVYRNTVTLHANERQRIVVAVRDATTDAVGMATEVVNF